MRQPNRQPAMLLMGNEGGGIASLMEIILSQLLPDRLPDVIVLGEGAMLDRVCALGIAPTCLGKSPIAVIHSPGRFGKLRSLWGYVRSAVWMVQRTCKVVWYLRHTRPGVLHVNPTYPLLIAILSRGLHRTPILCHWHVIGVRGITLRYKWLVRHFVDRFLAISHTVQASLPKSWQDKTQVVNNGIEVARLCAAAQASAGRLRRLAKVKPDTQLIVSLATYIPIKGQHLLVEAMAEVAGRLPDAVCVFLGRTPSAHCRDYLQEITDRAAELGIADRCRFMLEVPDAAALLVDADVLALTTWGVGEGFGLVAAEAMACGIPVVAFDAGAAREIILDDRTGLLVPDCNCHALAEAIISLLDDPPRARTMGQAGNERVRQYFNAHRLAYEVVDVYRNMVRLKEPQDREASR